MATAIHHGPPGSYKSFSLVQRHLIPALKEGRTVVTNVRGLNSIDRIIRVFPDIEIPITAQIIWVDTTKQRGRLKMACWFHWVPFGALIIIDEIQQIYPDRTDFKLTSLDKFYPELGDIIYDLGQCPEPRPEDVYTAYDKQRHFNWDVFASTTNIAKVKKEIRQVSDWAYRHRSTSGLLPWKKHTWYEHQHDAETSGKSKTHVVGSPTEYRADERYFKCYDSTATGEHVKSTTGRSIFSDKKLQAVALVFVLSVCFMIYSISSYIQNSEKNKQKNQQVETKQNNHKNDYSKSIKNVAKATNEQKIQQNTIYNLTPEQIRHYSLNGLTVEDVENLPVSCSITSHRVSCFTGDQIQADQAINKTCQKTEYGRFCHMHFFITKPGFEETKNVLAALTESEEK